MRSFANSSATAATTWGSLSHFFSASVDLLRRWGRGAMEMASAHRGPLVGHSCTGPQERGTEATRRVSLMGPERECHWAVLELSMSCVNQTGADGSQVWFKPGVHAGLIAQQESSRKRVGNTRTILNHPVRLSAHAPCDVVCRRKCYLVKSVPVGHGLAANKSS